MKKLFLLLFISTALFSCKKDDASAPSIIGKWTLQSYKEKTTIPGSTPTESTSPGNGETIEFKTDNTVESCTNGTDCYSLNYNITNSILSVSETTDFTNAADKWELKTFTNNSLVLYQKSTESIQGDVIINEAWWTLSK
ncbi:MAG: hypothetical protein FGM46_00185 [Ferruginibacter sp.]|nr:hypothetical protein [Ferruginibacter sp.]